ncbi:35999_t:CDS:2 [Gigaspora margarita]|uniref:35999_t:CDS:1 n=1 Tax=Gigaspora margarita TaxID=4874 RepID=A0ABN7VEE9_GIGMA|nr:35999_t:CDS:2 [Gigaspora margarita]
MGKEYINYIEKSNASEDQKLEKPAGLGITIYKRMNLKTQYDGNIDEIKRRKQHQYYLLDKSKECQSTSVNKSILCWILELMLKTNEREVSAEITYPKVL